MSPRSRAGFTLVEVMVAVVILIVGILALLGTNRVALLSMQRATLETRVTRLLEEGTERLRALPVDSLADGMATRPEGTSSWVVSDSAGFRAVRLVVRARPEGGRTLVDTVWLYRPR